MKKTKFLLIFITLIFIHACGSFENVGKVMRNEKIRTTDEFLIEKRQPLSLPPKFGELPKPGSKNNNKNTRSVNEILNVPTNNEANDSSVNSSVEKSIINKIGK